MSPLLAWGVPVIVWLQSLGDGLRGPAQALSALGSEPFFLLLMPCVLWCFDAALGLRLGLLLTGGACLNGTVKLACGLPRPYWVSSQVHAWGTERSFGLPSGHAQNSVAIWGAVAAALRRPWAYVAAGVLILAISASRWVLGVHFPTDTLAGWLIGGALLAGFALVERSLAAWYLRLAPGKRLLAAALPSVALLALGLAVRAHAFERGIPVSWAQTAAPATPRVPAIDPLDPAGIVGPAGALLGIAVGGTLLLNWGGFDPRRRGEWRALRLLVGLVGLLTLYYGLWFVTPHDQSALSEAIRYLRYAVVGIWGSYLAPWLFVKLKLA